MNFELWLKESKKTTVQELCNEICTDTGDVANYAQPIAGANTSKMATEPIQVDTDLKPKRKKKKSK
jgi:hypothetical protein